MVELELSSFSKSKNGKMGLREKCKRCCSYLSKIYREKNKGKLLQKTKEKNAARAKNGYYTSYRQSNSKKLKEYRGKYYLENKQKINKMTAAYYENNRLNILKQMKEYRDSNKDLIKKRKRKYALENREKINARVRSREKRGLSANTKLRGVLRARIRVALKSYKKSESTKRLIGCDLDFYRNYLESRFTKGMTWEKHGKNGWHIDHIIPCSKFDLSDLEQRKLCFHYTNTIPRWATTAIAIAHGETLEYIGNLEKSDKII